MSKASERDVTKRESLRESDNTKLSVREYVKRVRSEDGWVAFGKWLECRSHGSSGHVWLRSKFPGNEDPRGVLLGEEDFGVLAEVLGSF